MAKRTQEPAISPADSLRAEAAKENARLSAIARAQRFTDEWGRTGYGVETRSGPDTAALIAAYKDQGGRFESELFLVEGPHGMQVGLPVDRTTDDQIEQASSNGPWSSDSGRRERARLNRQRASDARERREIYNRKLHQVGRRVACVYISVSDGDGGSKSVWCLEDGRLAGHCVPVVDGDAVTDARGRDGIQADLARKLTGQ